MASTRALCALFLAISVSTGCRRSEPQVTDQRKTVDVWLKDYKDPDPSVRNTALGACTALPPLLAALSDIDWKMRKTAIEVHWKIGPAAQNAGPFIET